MQAESAIVTLIVTIIVILTLQIGNERKVCIQPIITQLKTSEIEFRYSSLKLKNLRVCECVCMCVHDMD